MLKNIKITAKFFALILLIPIAYVLGCVLHGTLTDYQPDDQVPLAILGKADRKPTTIADSVLTFANWNVGYGGLGNQSDFFYDNNHFFRSAGMMVRSPEALVKSYLAGQQAFVAANKADFYLFQEVDSLSKRSYFTDELSLLGKPLFDSGYCASFAVNFNVKRVPIPVAEPWNVLGKAYGGLATYSRFVPSEATRMQFPSKFGFPTRLFELDRCFALHRFPTANGKELVVINSHNSAYDNGSLKKKEMDYFKKIIEQEYASGNYVVVGADWNQCPPNFKFDTFMPKRGGGYSQLNIAADYLPEDWIWAYDPTVPTNRKLSEVYDAEKTFRTLIDFYLVSPNVEVLEVKGVDNDFAYSDHQPVLLKIRLK